MTPDPLSPSSLLAPLFSSPDMRAVLEDGARVQRMLDFEAALVRAAAAVGIVPSGHVNVIAEACRAELYDLAELREGTAVAGNLATPLVNALTAEVGKSSRKAAAYVHWGATGQDVIDTATVLELRAAIDALLADLDRATKAFIALAGRNRRNITVARTLLQQALPMPLGLKFAGYAAALGRSRDRLRRLRKDALVLQFGGAAGTLAALDEKGLEVSERLAALLDLTLPDSPWHSHRDRLAEVAAAFAILAGTCGKIARDIALLMQNEIGEVAEPSVPGRGGSATLPQTRNPVGAAMALSAAMVAPNLASTILTAQIQEHERSVGGWQAEWATFPALALVVSGTLRAVVEIAEGLTIDVNRMKANLEASGGLVFSEAVSYALAEKLGRAEAIELVAQIARDAEKQKRPFKDVLSEHDKVKLQISLTELERLFRPNHYLGSAQNFIDRLVASAQGRTVRRSVSHLLEPKLPAANSEQLSAVSAATSALIATASPGKSAPDLTSPAPSAEKPVIATPGECQPPPKLDMPSLPRITDMPSLPKIGGTFEALPVQPQAAAPTGPAAADDAPAPRPAPSEPAPPPSPVVQTEPVAGTPQPESQPMPDQPAEAPSPAKDDDEKPGALLDMFARIEAAETESEPSDPQAARKRA